MKKRTDCIQDIFHLQHAKRKTNLRTKVKKVKNLKSTINASEHDLVVGCQAVHHVVGVQHGHLAGPLQTPAPHHAQVGPRDRHDGCRAPRCSTKRRRLIKSSDTAHTQMGGGGMTRPPDPPPSNIPMYDTFTSYTYTKFTKKKTKKVRRTKQ